MILHYTQSTYTFKDMLSKSFKSLQTVTPVATRAMASSNNAPPKRVVVTGAAGAISYATLFRIARYENSS